MNSTMDDVRGNVSRQAGSECQRNHKLQYKQLIKRQDYVRVFSMEKVNS